MSENGLQYHSQPETVSHRFTTPDGRLVEIRDVWMSNIDEEMENIRNILDQFPYIAMVSIIYNIQLHASQMLKSNLRIPNFLG
jgi:hypothetical protein